MHKVVMYCDKYGKEYEKRNYKQDEFISKGEKTCYIHHISLI